MSRDTRLYLEDMLEACRRIGTYASGTTFEAFATDLMRRDAVERNLEILGEAAKKVPADTRLRLAGIDWREACAFRDILAHAYFGLDLSIVWEVATVRAPAIARLLDEYLAQPQP